MFCKGHPPALLPMHLWQNGNTQCWGCLERYNRRATRDFQMAEKKANRSTEARPEIDGGIHRLSIFDDEWNRNVIVRHPGARATTKKLKTPQQKKELEYSRDHFTFSDSPHAFRRTWKLKKKLANREYRRKSDELLVKAKPEISADDAEVVVEDLTVAHLKKPVLRKRLQKSSTVTLGQKVQIKLEKRKETVGRRVNQHLRYDAIATEAVNTLNSLEGRQLADYVERSARFLVGGDPIEWMRLQKSTDPIDRALYFLERLTRGDGYYLDALRRNQDLCKSFLRWRDKANRVLAKVMRPAQGKLEQKQVAAKKVNALRR